MSGKFIKNFGFTGLFAIVGLAACGNNQTPTPAPEEKTSVTVEAVEHASALVAFGSLNEETWTWDYSFDPIASISDYVLTDNDKSLLIELTADEGYNITAVAVNGQEITSYWVGDARAIYPMEEAGDYVVTLTVEEKPSYDSRVTHIENVDAFISYVVIDGDWNEYMDIEYDGDDDFIGHISFPYSEFTVIDITVNVMDPLKVVESVLVNGEATIEMVHPMLGYTYYEYEVTSAGEYVITVNLTDAAE